MSRIRRILIVGHGRAGKDTAAIYLSKLTTIPYAGSTSWAAKEIVAEQLEIHEQEAWETRHTHRAQWKSICDAVREKHQTILIERALASVNMNSASDFLEDWSGIVVGVRDYEEIYAAKQQKLFGRILWIDRPGIPEDPTVTFTASDCDEVIVNDGTLDRFKIELFLWAERNELIPALYLSGKSPTDDTFRE